MNCLAFKILSINLTTAVLTSSIFRSSAPSNNLTSQQSTQSIMKNVHRQDIFIHKEASNFIFKSYHLLYALYNNQYLILPS